MIEVIQIFVTENGRVPTDEEITSILDTTASELTDLSANNDIETSITKEVPLRLEELWFFSQDQGYFLIQTPN